MRIWLRWMGLGVLVLAAGVLAAGVLVRPVVAQDLNTLLTYFISDLRAGTFSIGTGKDVTIASDGEGAVTIAGNGDGSDEALTVNLDDTADTATLTSTTGVVTLQTPFTFVTLGGTAATFPGF